MFMQWGVKVANQSLRMYVFSACHFEIDDQFLSMRSSLPSTQMAAGGNDLLDISFCKDPPLPQVEKPGLWDQGFCQRPF